MLYHAIMENFKKDYRFEIVTEDPDDLLDVCSKIQCAFVVCHDLVVTHPLSQRILLHEDNPNEKVFVEDIS